MNNPSDEESQLSQEEFNREMEKMEQGPDEFDGEEWDIEKGSMGGKSRRHRRRSGKSGKSKKIRRTRKHKKTRRSRKHRSHKRRR